MSGNAAMRKLNHYAFYVENKQTEKNLKASKLSFQKYNN